MKKNNLIIKILIIVLIILVIALLGIFIYSKVKTEEEPKVLTNAEVRTLSKMEQTAEDKSSTLSFTCEETTNEEDIASNIKILGESVEDKGTSYGTLKIMVKNNNNLFVYLSAIVTFYDSDGNSISTSKSYGDTIQPCGYGILNFNTIPTEYDSYEVEFEASDDYYYYASKPEKIEEKKTELKNLELTVKNDGKNIYGTVKNNNSDSKTYDVCVAYYYKEEFVRGECITQISQSSGGTEQNKFKNYYFDKKYKGFNFDSYKVFIM